MNTTSVLYSNIFICVVLGVGTIITCKHIYFRNKDYYFIDILLYFISAFITSDLRRQKAFKQNNIDTIEKVEIKTSINPDSDDTLYVKF